MFTDTGIKQPIRFARSKPARAVLKCEPKGRLSKCVVILSVIGILTV